MNIDLKKAKSRTKRSLLMLVSICLPFLFNGALQAQVVSKLNIDSCYAAAKRNYPMVKQFALIEKSKEYSIENANKSYLPQFSIAGQATYQSAVTKLPVSLPNFSMPELSKNQFRLYGEVNQPLSDLFVVKDHLQLIEANAAVEEQKIEVELFKLKERINQLFFGILLIDAQLQQTELYKKDIQNGIDKTHAAIANGIALKSNADILKAELLKVNQKTIELKSNRKGFTDMLSLFINSTISESTVFEKPMQQTISANINRPELKLFDIQKKSFDIQNKLITAKNLPHFNFFFQGGLGRPALNMLSNDVKGYYITGLRLNWNLTGLYTANKEKKIVSLQQNALDIQKETFLFNTNFAMHQQSSEITKLQELIISDTEIILLRESIKNTAKNQLEYGTATTNDYLSYLNAEDQARQNQLLHEIQLLMAEYNYQTTSGN